MFPPAIVPALPPIPVTTSKTARHGHVTFLDLPAEIRNAIYAFALVLPDPLMVASSHLYRIVADDNHALVATKASRSEYPTLTRDHNLQATDSELEKGRPRKLPQSNLAPVCLPGLRIFLACRQVYHEATSVFFSQNTFAVSRPRCSPWDGGQGHDDAGALFYDGADWVLSLGSQLSKLNMIILDLNALCLMHGGNLELLPLLRAFWNRNWNGKLNLKSPSALASRERICGESGKSPGIGDSPDLATINEMIASLLQDDLSIRKHAWALSHVAIHCKRLEGVVLYRLNRNVRCKLRKTHKYHSRYSNLRSDGSCLEHRQNFRYDNGKCAITPERMPHLLEIPVHIRQQIFDHVLYSSEPVTVDLSSGTGGKLPALLYANAAIHNAGSKQYYRLNSTNLLFKYKIGEDEVLNFDKMVRWMYSPASPRLDEDLKELRRDSVESLTFDVESLHGGPRRLEDLRINTSVLWHKRVRLRPRSKETQVEVRLWSNSKGEEVYEEAAFTFEHLLTTISRALRGLYEANMGLRRSSMLEIVVDGRGEPKCYVFPATGTMHPFPRIET